MVNSKGQGMIDSLMLVLVMSIILVSVNVFIGQESLRAQQLKYESVQHQTTLLSILNSYAEFKGEDNSIAFRGRIIDAISICGCTEIQGSKDFCKSLGETIRSRIESIKHASKHFIFQANSTSTYDDKPTVCLEEIPIASFEFTTTCPAGERNLKAVYGSWFEWDDPKEVC